MGRYMLLQRGTWGSRQRGSFSELLSTCLKFLDKGFHFKEPPDTLKPLERSQKPVKRLRGHHLPVCGPFLCSKDCLLQ